MGVPGHFFSSRLAYPQLFHLEPHPCPELSPHQTWGGFPVGVWGKGGESKQVSLGFPKPTCGVFSASELFFRLPEGMNSSRAMVGRQRGESHWVHSKRLAPRFGARVTSFRALQVRKEKLLEMYREFSIELNTGGPLAEGKGTGLAG